MGRAVTKVQKARRTEVPKPLPGLSRFLIHRLRKVHLSNPRAETIVGLGDLITSHSVTHLLFECDCPQPQRNQALVRTLIEELVAVDHLEVLEIKTWSVLWHAILNERQAARHSFGQLFGAFLGRNVKLHSFTFNGRVSDGVVAYLLKFLPTSVTELNLSDNCLSMDLVYVILFVVMRNSVTKLRINNCIASEHVRWAFYSLLDELFVACSSLRHLSGLEGLLTGTPPMGHLPPPASVIQEIQMTSTSALDILLDHIRQREFLKLLRGHRVRVWWSPSSRRDREEFAGRYWPATVISSSTDRDVALVRYDNGDSENVSVQMIQPLSPLKYGGGFVALPADSPSSGCTRFQCATTCDECLRCLGDLPLREREFVDIRLDPGSSEIPPAEPDEADPSDFLGRIARIVDNDTYQVSFPYHDDGPQFVHGKDIRRAVIVAWDTWRDWFIDLHRTHRRERLYSPRWLSRSLATRGMIRVEEPKERPRRGLAASAGDGNPPASLANLIAVERSVNNALNHAMRDLALSPSNPTNIVPGADLVFSGSTLDLPPFQLLDRTAEVSENQLSKSPSSLTHIPINQFVSALKKDSLRATASGLSDLDRSNFQDALHENSLLTAQIRRLNAASEQVQQELAAATRELQCVICMEARWSVLLVPCHHGRVCPACVENLSTCPFCRRAIDSTISVAFMSLSDPLKPDELLKFRTNYCKRLLQSGICRFAGSCQYSHTSEWCRRDLTRTNYCARLCSHVRLDGEGIVSVALSTCEAGKCCPFAHTLEEVFYHPDVYKTLPCSKVMEHPFQCDREYCPFAHSPEELRPSTHPTNLLRLTNFTLPRYTSQESRHNIHRRLPCAHIVRHVNADTREIHPNLLVERGELEVFTWSCAQGLFQGRLVIVWLLPLPMETLEFAERFAARVGCAFPQVVQSGTCQLETLTCLFVVQVAGLQMISTPVSDKESFAREVLGQLEALRQQGIYVDALDQYSVMYDSESGTPAVQFPYKSLLLAVARTFGLLRDHPELTRALIGVPDCYWKPPEVVLQDFRLSQDRTLSSASGLADHALTWSAGCYLAYMTAGVHPFGSMDDLEGLLLNAATNDLVNFRIGDLWTQMLGMMLDARPTERKNLQSALHHPALWSHKTWTAVTSGITGLSPVILPLVDRLPGLPTAQMKNTGLTFSGTSDVVLNSELLLMCAANPKSAVSLLSMHAPLAMALAQLLPCHE